MDNKKIKDEQMTKNQAIKSVMKQYPAVSVAVATYYVEEVLGYHAD